MVDLCLYMASVRLELAHGGTGDIQGHRCVCRSTVGLHGALDNNISSGLSLKLEA